MFIIPVFMFIIPEFMFIIPVFMFIIPVFMFIIPVFMFIIPAFMFIIPAFMFIILFIKQNQENVIWGATITWSVTTGSQVPVIRVGPFVLKGCWATLSYLHADIKGPPHLCRHPCLAQHEHTYFMVSFLSHYYIVSEPTCNSPSGVGHTWDRAQVDGDIRGSYCLIGSGQEGLTRHLPAGGNKEKILVP